MCAKLFLPVRPFHLLYCTFFHARRMEREKRFHFFPRQRVKTSSDLYVQVNFYRFARAEFQAGLIKTYESLVSPTEKKISLFPNANVTCCTITQRRCCVQNNSAASMNASTSVFSRGSSVSSKAEQHSILQDKMAQ